MNIFFFCCLNALQIYKKLITYAHKPIKYFVTNFCSYATFPLQSTHILQYSPSPHLRPLSSFFPPLLPAVPPL